MKEIASRFSILVLMTLLGNVPVNAVEDKNPFAGESLPNGWAWKRPNPEAWRLRDGGLEIKIEPGNMWGGKNDAKNVLLIPVAGDLLESGTDVQVTLANSPTQRWEQVDLVWYYRDSHMVKIGLELEYGKNSVVMGREEEDRTRTIRIIPIEKDEVTVRLRVAGGQVRGYYRLATEDQWTDVGTCTEPRPTGSNDRAQVSIQGYQGDPQNPHWARITGLTIDSATKTREGSNARMQWWRESRFGMFIHWGPYSELAGEWKGQRVEVGRNAEWIMKFLKIPAAEYREMARQFNPVKFDAEAWVRLAQATGMRYLVVTAKHHDGFAMYHSKVSPYNIVDWTPFQRDPLKELSEACARAGIRFCVYYSHREDWDDPDAYGNDWDYDPAKQNFEAYLERKSKPQLRELLTDYGPVGLVWFDRGLYTPEQAQDFVQLVRGIQPACLINGRVGHYEQELMGDYQNMNDNGMPAGGIEEDWETPQTLNETWGYSRFDTKWKSPEVVVRRLVEIVSKGGNYLLNIGPRGDGSIPEASVATLEQVGAWMRKNGASIHGASASPFLEFPWGRCTVKDNVLYLHVFKRPADGALELPGLRNKVRKAYLLADSGKSLESSRSGSSVRTSLPPTPADAIDTVVALELDGPPRVEPPVIVEKAGAPVVLDYLNAVTSGRTVKRFNRRGQFHISKWTGPGDQASWRVHFLQPGRYRVLVECAGAFGRPTGTFVLSSGEQKVQMESPQASDWYQYASREIGVLDVAAAGEHELVLRPAREIGQDVMCFKSLKLERLP